MKKFAGTFMLLLLSALAGCGKSPADEFKQYLTVDLPTLLKEEQKWVGINYPEYAERGQITAEEAKVKMAEQISLCKVEIGKIEALGYKTSPTKELVKNLSNQVELGCSRRQDLLDMVTLNDPIQTDRLSKHIEEIDAAQKQLLDQYEEILKENCPKFECTSYLKIVK